MDSHCNKGFGSAKFLQQPLQPTKSQLWRVLQWKFGPHGPNAGINSPVNSSSLSSSIVKLRSNDIFQEYCNWQNPQKPGQFSYCQYPFVISIVGKRNILTKDSEQQMILTARRWAMKKKPQCLLDLTYCLSLNIISIMLNSLGVLFKIWFDTRCPT